MNETRPIVPSDAAPSAQARQVNRVAWALVLLLFVVVTPLRLWRASLESTFWIDEVYSVELANFPLRTMFDLTAVDAHPPGYYLELKIWNRLGRSSGMEPGVFWGRLLGTLAWAAMVFAIWLLGRMAMGPVGGALLACVVGFSSPAAWTASQMRGYSLAFPALTVCFMILIALRRRTRADCAGGLDDAVLWALYGFCAALSLWNHLLSAIVLFLFGLLWIAWSFSAGSGRRGWIVGGAIAQACAILLFLPWAVKIGDNLGYLYGQHLDWMTPATVGNFLRVFLFWYPLGDAPAVPRGLLLALGGLSLLVPVFALVWACLFKPRKDRRDEWARWRMLALTGLGIALANVAILWIVHRAGFWPLFHGPRYPVFTAGCWAAGLVGLAGWAVARAGWRLAWIWALLAPWFLAGTIGQALMARVEPTLGLKNWRYGTQLTMPAPGRTIYMMPSEFIPYFRDSLAGYRLERIEALADAAPADDSVWVLCVLPWKDAMRERDAIVYGVLLSGELCRETKHEILDTKAQFYELFTLTGFRPRKAHETLAGALSFIPIDAPPEALASVHPRQLWRVDGWGGIEGDEARRAWRWTQGERSRLTIPGQLGPGPCTIHLLGLRQPYPTDRTRLKIDIEGEPRGYEVELPPHYFRLEIPIDLASRHTQLRLDLRHPTFVPSDWIPGSTDHRPLGFRFQALWVTGPES